MTDTERKEFEEMKRTISDQGQRLIKLEGANDLLNKRILSALQTAEQKGLLPRR